MVYFPHGYNLNIFLFTFKNYLQMKVKHIYQKVIYKDLAKTVLHKLLKPSLLNNDISHIIKLDKTNIKLKITKLPI